MNKRGRAAGGVEITKYLLRIYVVVSTYPHVNPSRKSRESFLHGEKAFGRDALLKKEDSYRFHKDEWHSNYVARVDETAPRITKIDDPANRIFEVDIGDSRIGMCWLLGFERGGNIGISELQL